jgi:hypothetical protein
MERRGHEQPGRSGPQIHDLVGTGTECDHGLGLTGLEHIEKLVPPVLNPEDRNPNDPVEIVVPMRTTHPLASERPQSASRSAGTVGSGAWS